MIHPNSLRSNHPLISKISEYWDVRVAEIPSCKQNNKMCNYWDVGRLKISFVRQGPRCRFILMSEQMSEHWSSQMSIYWDVGLFCNPSVGRKCRGIGRSLYHDDDYHWADKSIFGVSTLLFGRGSAFQTH